MSYRVLIVPGFHGSGEAHWQTWLEQELPNADRVRGIDWESPVYEGRLMVPFLGSSLNDVIKSGELRVAFRNHRLVFEYYDAVYPLNLRSYLSVLTGEGEDFSNWSSKILALA